MRVKTSQSPGLLLSMLLPLFSATLSSCKPQAQGTNMASYEANLEALDVVIRYDIDETFVPPASSAAEQATEDDIRVSYQDQPNFFRVSGPRGSAMQYYQNTHRDGTVNAEIDERNRLIRIRLHMEREGSAVIASDYVSFVQPVRFRSARILYGESDVRCKFNRDPVYASIIGTTRPGLTFEFTEPQDIVRSISCRLPDRPIYSELSRP